MAVAHGMVQDRDAHVLAGDRAVIVAPAGWLRPGVLVDEPIAVDDPTTRLGIDRHAGRHTDEEARILAVVEPDRAGGRRALSHRAGKLLVDVDRTGLAFGSEREPPLLHEEGTASGIHVVAHFLDHGPVAIDGYAREFPVDDPAHGRQPGAILVRHLALAAGFLERESLVPGVATAAVGLRTGESVPRLGIFPVSAADALVAERDPAVVRMIPLRRRLLRQVAHWIGPRHRLAGGADDGPEVGLVSLVDHIRGEWTAIHLDRHARLVLPQREAVRLGADGLRKSRSQEACRRQSDRGHRP